ncbi:MAG: aromatic ring-hydroxylating dioxygenase subunit alpha [Actinomycetota bacterium]
MTETTPLVAAAGSGWVAAATSSQLDDGPVAATVLGVDLVIARLGDAVVALHDRCAHRGAPLSGGDVRIAPNGRHCLVCPYHGLHYGADGSAVHLPARPDARLARRLDLRTLPVEERHGLVWTSLVAEPEGQPPDFSAFDGPRLLRFQLEPERWEAAPGRIVENFNDLAHFPFVHADTFGDASHPDVGDIEVLVDGDTIRHGILMHQLDRLTLDGAPVPIEVAYSYVHSAPFATELRIRFDDDRTEWIQMTLTPIDDDRALVFQQNARNFDLDDDVGAYAKFQHAVNTEDRLLLERLTPRRVRPDGADLDEVALAVDGFTIAYRRWWAQRLHPEGAR